MEDEVIDQQQDEGYKIVYDETENTENDNPEGTGETVDTDVSSVPADDNTDSEVDTSTETETSEEPEYNEDFEPVNDAAKKVKESVPFVSLRNRYKQIAAERKQLVHQLQELQSQTASQIAKSPDPVEPLWENYHDVDYEFDDVAKSKDFKKDHAEYLAKVRAKEEAKAVLAKQQQGFQTWMQTAKSDSEKSFAKVRGKVKDFDKYAQTVANSLSPVQIDMLHLACHELKASTGDMVTLFGQNKSLLETVSNINDPIKFSTQIANIQSKLRNPTRKSPVNVVTTKLSTARNTATISTKDKAAIDKQFTSGKINEDQWRKLQNLK